MAKKPVSRKRKLNLETYTSTLREDLEKERLLKDKYKSELDIIGQKFFTVTWKDWTILLILFAFLGFLIMDRQRVLAFIFGLATILYILKMSIKVS